MAKYPYGLDLSPDGKLHAKLVPMILSAARRGYQAGSEARKQAREIDRTLRTFVPSKYTEKYYAMRDYDNPDAPLEIVIPASKNAHDTFLTYMAGVRLADPNALYRLEGGGGPRGLVRAAVFERLLNVQARWFGQDLSFMSFWGEAFAHGIGTIVPEWRKRTRRNPAVVEASDVLARLARKAGIKVSAGDLVRYLDEVIIHEGNKFAVVSIYDLILDPNVGLHEQENADSGRRERTNYQTLKRREQDDEDTVFNLDRVRDVIKARTGSTVASLLNTVEGDGGNPSRPVIDYGEYPGHDSENCETVRLYMRLIPKEHGLSKDERPSLYEFEIAEGEILIGLNQIDYDHGRLPMVFGSPSTSGFETFPISELGSTYGLQQFMDWKLRAQVANQSKCLNDMLLVDPSVFEEDDLMNPSPGKFIRTNRSLYGLGGIEKFIKQLVVQDVTGGNLNDVGSMLSLMNQMLGTSDITMGDMSSLPDRPTAALGMAARSSALSRLQYMAQKMASQTMESLIWMQAHNTLQFMDPGIRISITGSRFEQDIRAEYGLADGESEIEIDPWKLDLNFHVASQEQGAHDGDIAAMGAFVERIISIPELANEVFSGLDARGLVMAYARKAGFSNVHEFVKKTGGLPQIGATSMPDAQVLQQVQAGNLVPAEEMMA